MLRSSLERKKPLAPYQYVAIRQMEQRRKPLPFGSSLLQCMQRVLKDRPKDWSEASQFSPLAFSLKRDDVRGWISVRASRKEAMLKSKSLGRWT